MTKPNILLADEPTGSLDSMNSESVIDLIVSANKNFNQTIILITHAQNIVDNFVEGKQAKLVNIKDGRLVY